MGLTIHYRLSAPAGAGPVEVQRLMAAANLAAWRRTGPKGFRTGGWGGWDRERRQWARRWRMIPLGQRIGVFGLPVRSVFELEIEPVDGWMFEVDAGRDCEPLRVALCRYPASVPMPWQLAAELGLKDCRRRVSTGLPRRWHFRGFAKTQFASLHGWEHFRRCHTGIIDYLAELRTLGWGVRIDDEGEYWPRRSLAKLRRNIDEMNGVVAAAAGALKDLDEAANGVSGVESPIFAHRDFERLEAEGEARAGGMTRQARAATSRLSRTPGPRQAQDSP